MNTNARTPTPQLPLVIRDYLAAHIARDTQEAVSAFTDDAVVIDQDESFRGTAQIRDFLTNAGAEYDYTTRTTDARRVDENHWVVTNRIEGNFPGGVADLEYRFTLDGALIAELVIASA